MNSTDHFEHFLLDHYNNGLGGERSVEIKFEAAGRPLTENDSTDYVFSKLANVYPQAESKSFFAALQKLDSLYAMLLNNATLRPGDADPAFTKMKANALRNMEKTERAPDSSTAIFYHLSSAIPGDWHSNDACWSVYDTPQLSLEYCIVKIERKWIDYSIFTLYRNWFIPNMKKGQLAKTPVGLQQIPEAIIMVRAVIVKTKQTSGLDFLQTVSNHEITLPSEHKNQLNQHPHIIGWLCSTLPDLPPLYDPALIHRGIKFIKIQHAGWYVAKFEVSWEEKDKNGDYIAQSWSSGKKTKGFVYQVDMPEDSINIQIKGWGGTGLAWEPWGQIMSIYEPLPTNKIYKVSGTTLNRKHEIQDT